MKYPEGFVKAFNHAMLYEIGAFFNPADPDVVAGRISTREQRQKVGYVNIPNDRGGETKYGVAQKANTDVNVNALNLDGAMQVYFTNYWMRGKCDALPYPLALIHFDGCVNHGIGRANKFLQRSVGAVEDGQIGPNTLRAIANGNQRDMITKISQYRSAFYNSIVERDPSQKMFLVGWTRRINEVTDFTLKSL
jgi:lysozyme family protein